MINIDWFQPYKHLTYSVGAIYLTIFNLPRSLHYKLENICLVGIIPGPHEPDFTVNSRLAPLVRDLLHFWDGVELSVSDGVHIERKLVRCAIICCSCDLPAGSYVAFWDTVLTWVVRNVLSSFLPWKMVLSIPVLIEEVGFLVPIIHIGKML